MHQVVQIKKNKWIKFATIDLSDARGWKGCNGILIFFPTEATTVTGFLKFQFRNGRTAGTIGSENLSLVSINDTLYKNSVCAVSTGNGTRDLYYKPISDYDSTAIVAVNIYNRKQFTLQSDSIYVESVDPTATSSIQSYASTAENATKATALTSSAGSATQPVYFSSGKPVPITYTIGKSVPSNAVFTDTTYTSKPATSGGTEVSLVTTGEKAAWNAKTSNNGTLTGIKMNGESKGTSGTIDLGTVLTGGYQTTTSSADGGSNVYTFSDKSTLTVKNGTKGSTGATGTRGSVINYGTAITGTSTTATVFSNSGLASSLVNDLYIHTTTFNIYRCTNAGNASVAKWVYVGCLKGAKGDKGANGTNATTTAVATTSANGLMSKDMVTKLNGIATGAINVVESADEPTNQNTGDLWFELVEEISL